MPVVSQPVSDRRLALGRLAIMITVTAWIGYFVWWLLKDLLNRHYSGTIDRVESITYLLIVTVLTASSLAYLLSRLGYCYRTRSHHRASRAILERFYDVTTPTLTTIVPSYQEEERVIRSTLLSAALQEYPGQRIVLLIDDPQTPRTEQARELLNAARALPGEIEALLAGPADRFGRALESFESAFRYGAQPGFAVMVDLIQNYDAAVGWLENLAVRQEITDHTDTFFANEVVLRLAESLRTIAVALRDSLAEGVVLSPSQLRRLYRRLAWTFRAELSSFERKRYVSLSHEPNKAMNLNSYIGLMGGTYRCAQTPTGLALVPASPAVSDLIVPDTDYVVTLDADSVLLPEYCLRLVHLLEQGEHRDTAIAQTPYSAFPGSATRLERIAGATTDLQHIVHQGLTYYDATFWVGANAVIRKRALDDIAETSYIGDWEIRHYIKDRTVIEDTESTIDMGIHGWRLFNSPERMSYSATPPDFGSLCIQRQRWANGGLLILPKLRQQSRARRARGTRTRFGELFLRWNYMASICWSSFSLLILLAFPFNATLISPLLGLVALPYFMAMASDLRYCGYKRMDIFRIYGFNLILLPVNLAGTVSSLAQGITASKSAFARTPKVKNRTVAPPFFVIAPYLVIALAGFTLYFAYRHHQVENMAYAALNVILAGYAVVAFIGLRNSVVDAWIHLTSLLYKPQRSRRRLSRATRTAQPVPAPDDWRAVLEVGLTDTGQWAITAGPQAPARRAIPQPGRAFDGPGTALVPGGRGLAPPKEAIALPDPPRRRLSVLRLLLACCLLAGLGYGGYLGWRTRLDNVTAVRQTWFAPYVDVTLPPTYQFQNASANPARQTILGFVVARSSASCAPSWGAAYTMDQADQSLALGSRVAQLQQDGAQVIASFGGQAHTSLDVACTSVPRLTQAYQSVIDQYHLTTIDLDIEGAALDNFQAAQRRAAVVAALEQSARAQHRKLDVWLTLPVEPSGLQANALSVIDSMLHNRAAITGVNIMAMDFTQAPHQGDSMLLEVQSALAATHTQLASVLSRYGLNLTANQVWQRIGVTVMIGQNDLQGERFTVPDAQGLTTFASHNHLGRVSMWSLNRDTQCGASFPENGLLSNACSGTAQASLQFSRIFGAIPGQAPATSRGAAANVLLPKPDLNPADAPYPQWSPTAAYQQGYKIVENGEIYQAKWFNTGQDPAAAVQYSWQTPWELLGPVLPGDHAPARHRLRAGTYAAWSLNKVYRAGNKVLYQGEPYQAKWSNQGVSPAGQAADPAGSPWRPLFRIPGEPVP
jgi:cellulose synthase/poly-beta-1,6-N-acetylglucosamine synthase-like glycosyltransferase/chitodextrinase